MSWPRAASALWALLLAASLACAYFYFLPEPPVVGTHVPAQVAPEAIGVATEPLVLDVPLQVFPDEVKVKLDLPPSAASSKVRVVASSKVRGDERPHTITTVVDTGTGKVTTFDRADPLPWIVPNTTTHLAAYYGIKNGDPVVRVQGQQEFLRVKALHVEGIASADIPVSGGEVDTFVGVGARWSF